MVTAKTHLMAALLIGTLIAAVADVPNVLLFVGLVLVASLAPDLDNPESTLGGMTKPVSNFLRLTLGHRGFLHTIYMALSIPVLLYFLGYIYPAVAVGIGYLSHLMMDSITIFGIKPFFPIQFDVRGSLRTGGPFELVIFTILGIGFLIVLNIFYLKLSFGDVSGLNLITDRLSSLLAYLTSFIPASITDLF